MNNGITFDELLEILMRVNIGLIFNDKRIPDFQIPDPDHHGLPVTLHILPTCLCLIYACI